MPTKPTSFALAAAVLAVPGCYEEHRFGAPWFEGQLSTGEWVDKRSLSGKVVVLDFWATWCMPCLQDMKAMHGIHQKYAGEDVVVIAVHVDDPALADPSPLEFLESRGYAVACIPDGRVMAEVFKVGFTPTVIVLDKEGKIIEEVFGSVGSRAQTVEYYSELIDPEL